MTELAGRGGGEGFGLGAFGNLVLVLTAESSFFGTVRMLHLASAPRLALPCLALPCLAGDPEKRQKDKRILRNLFKKCNFYIMVMVREN